MTNFCFNMFFSVQKWIFLAIISVNQIQNVKLQKSGLYGTVSGFESEEIYEVGDSVNITYTIWLRYGLIQKSQFNRN